MAAPVLDIMNDFKTDRVVADEARPSFQGILE
jgi:hypothetical protein